MVLACYVIVAWLSVMVLVCLPRKLSAVSNVLLYMTLSIVDINKFTLLTYRFRLIEVKRDAASYITTVIYRDVVFSFALMIFANIWLTAPKGRARALAAAAVFLYLFTVSLSLRWTHVYTYRKWGVPQEALMIGSLMVIVLWLGKWVRFLDRSEVHLRG
jgi:hypothetical protein